MSNHEPGEEQAERIAPRWPYYVAPMALFLLFTWVEGQSQAWYPWLYGAMALVVTAALIVCRSTWRDIRWEPRFLPAAAAVGLLVFAEWVLLPRWVDYPRMGGRSAFDPAQIGDPTARIAFLAVRFYGLVVMVPVMEELFWRSFLLRALSSPGWRRMPVGSFTMGAFAVSTAGFALAHPEWLEAAICAAAYSLLLLRTRSLFACVVAHAVTNLALGIYVMATGTWSLW